MIGIIPAAGKAERMHGLPKFLLPVGDSYLLKVLADRMQNAGTSAVFVKGSLENIETLYTYAPQSLSLSCCDSPTMSQTVLWARSQYDELRNENVLFAMPDTYWEDETVLNRLAASADEHMISAALFKVRPGQSLGMCTVDEYGYVTQVIDKPRDTNLIWAWGALAWRPPFWDYIDKDDPHVGFAVQRAIKSGARVKAVFAEGNYWDCGTPAEYFHVIRHLTREAVLE